MKNPTYLLLLLSATLVASCSESSDSTSTPESGDVSPNETNLPSGSAIRVLSNFDDGTNDGWAATDTDSASVSIDGNCGLVQVDPEPGYLCADASDSGGTSYFIAPEKFTGDLNVFATLNFSLVANYGRYYDSGFGFDGDIVISNGVSQAAYTFTEDQRPIDVWTDFEISLTDTERWVVDDGSALSTVLQSATELRVRAEYGISADNSGLDDVSLQ